MPTTIAADVTPPPSVTISASQQKAAILQGYDCDNRFFPPKIEVFYLAFLGIEDLGKKKKVKRSLINLTRNSSILNLNNIFWSQIRYQLLEELCLPLRGNLHPDPDEQYVLRFQPIQYALAIAGVDLLAKLWKKWNERERAKINRRIVLTGHFQSGKSGLLHPHRRQRQGDCCSWYHQ